jgi:CheY-like chemotaxis protein
MAESLKVLLVEDNMQMRVLLRQLLIALGLSDIMETTNGRDALAMVRDRQVNIIVTDLSMQHLDGIEFTRAVRQSPDIPNPYVPIIMVTGHTERHRVEAARDAGVTEFLAKPITTKNLFLRLSEIVERPRSFVRVDDYFGPDRRRRCHDSYHGPRRREDDREKAALQSADDSFLLERL